MDDSVKTLPKVREEANFQRERGDKAVAANERLGNSLQLSNAAQDSIRAAYSHQLQLDRDKDVQIAVLRAKATRRTLTTILSVLGNFALGFILLKH